MPTEEPTVGEKYVEDREQKKKEKDRYAYVKKYLKTVTQPRLSFVFVFFFRESRGFVPTGNVFVSVEQKREREKKNERERERERERKK